jgi:hypothetical protein
MGHGHGHAAYGNASTGTVHLSSIDTVLLSKQGSNLTSTV